MAFYDAGLGTDDDAAGAPTLFVRWLRKLLASVTGRGITRNIIECYQHVLDNWNEDDRIYIIGFSRGAYTARCIANLLELCGVPKVGPEGRPLARNKPEARTVAEQAVRDVYEHGAGRPAAKFDEERKELGRRFRAKYRSGDAEQSNVHPYFVGVFDTVASLGARGPVRFMLGLGLVLGLLVASMLVAAIARLAFDVRFWPAVLVMTGAALFVFAVSSIKSTLGSLKKPEFGFVQAKMVNRQVDRRRGLLRRAGATSDWLRALTRPKNAKST